MQRRCMDPNLCYQQIEHSVMMGSAYATTVLSTHYHEGSRLDSFNTKKLSVHAQEKVKMVKEAFDAEEVYHWILICAINR
jgi:hypothetical protein